MGGIVAYFGPLVFQNSERSKVIIMAQPEIVIVKFLKTSSPYSAGETAGFTKEVAEGLVKKGTAELVGDGKPKAVKK